MSFSLKSWSWKKKISLFAFKKKKNYLFNSCVTS